jgi:hypothetical protein
MDIRIHIFLDTNMNTDKFLSDTNMNMIFNLNLDTDTDTNTDQDPNIFEIKKSR